MGGGYTQQYINCRDIVVFLPDYLAYGRGERWIKIQQHTTIQQQSDIGQYTIV